MWRSVWLAVAACASQPAPDMPPDAQAVELPSPDDQALPAMPSPPPDLTPVVCEGAVADPTDTFQQCPISGACVRSTGVNWIEADYQSTFTVALPGGVYWDDPVAGCVWVVVWPGIEGHATVETATVGCTTSLVVSDRFVPGGCGHSYRDVAGCERVSVQAEVCSSDGRGVYASGGVTFAIDAVKGTLTSGGLGFDTSSSPAACGCP
jgi:hypothetical protein